MPETKTTNGRWKFSPMVAITLAINLIGWGITIGTILTRISAIEAAMAAEHYITYEEFKAREDAIAREHALIWDAIHKEKK